MLTFAVVVIASYLLGSIPFGYLAGRMAGIDIRNSGSGNVGATNVIRTLGKGYGYPVFALDFLKGLGAVKMSILIATRMQSEWNPQEMFGIVGAISSVLGHSFPIWLRFNGGKGVATSAGALFGLAPVAALVGVAIWAVTFWLTGYVSVASIAAAAALPFVDPGYNLAKSNHREVIILFIGLSRGSCDLASSFKPFAAHAWNGAAL